MNIILPLIILTLLVVGFFRFQSGKKQESQPEAEDQVPQADPSDRQEVYSPSEEVSMVVEEAPVEKKPAPKKTSSTDKTKKSPAKKETAPKKSSPKKTSGTKKTTTKKITK